MRNSSKCNKARGVVEPPLWSCDNRYHPAHSGRIRNAQYRIDVIQKGIRPIPTTTHGIIPGHVIKICQRFIIWSFSRQVWYCAKISAIPTSKFSRTYLNSTSLYNTIQRRHESPGRWKDRSPWSGPRTDFQPIDSKTTWGAKHHAH